jgi:uncharacterized oxidoreductase
MDLQQTQVFMDLEQTYVLITGGSDGIGFGLAERFMRAGATVLVTGRSREKLDTVAAALPGVLTYQSDVSDPVEREGLAAFVGRAVPGLNLLINNAGIQRRVALSADEAPWPERQQEIDTLFSGPVHLTQLLLPLLLSPGKQSVIVNVTSAGPPSFYHGAPVFARPYRLPGGRARSSRGANCPRRRHAARRPSP